MTESRVVLLRDGESAITLDIPELQVLWQMDEIHTMKFDPSYDMSK